MTRAIRIQRHGGVNELQLVDVALPELAPDEVKVRHTAIGLNFSDVNVRRGGFYPGHEPSFPLGLGNEAAGTVESIGSQVRDFQPGDRVGYAGMRGQFYEDTGAYAQMRHVPAERLVRIPDGVSDQQAAAVLLKGATASLIINRVYTPGPEDIILVHTAAAGVGSVLVQWAKHLGAMVIGTVGSRAKAEIAKSMGCDHVILYRETSFVPEVRKIAKQGLTAIFDGVGQDTFLPSLALLRQFGHAINYGNASGNVPPFNIMLLAVKSISITRVGVTGHIQDTQSFRSVAADLFELVQSGTIKVNIDRTYPLAAAAQAQADLEAGRFAGSILLLP
jgi:NADPH:quinone reductase